MLKDPVTSPTDHVLDWSTGCSWSSAQGRCHPLLASPPGQLGAITLGFARGIPTKKGALTIRRIMCPIMLIGYIRWIMSSSPPPASPPGQLGAITLGFARGIPTKKGALTIRRIMCPIMLIGYIRRTMSLSPPPASPPGRLGAITLGFARGIPTKKGAITIRRIMCPIMTLSSPPSCFTTRPAWCDKTWNCSWHPYKERSYYNKADNVPHNDVVVAPFLFHHLASLVW